MLKGRRTKYAVFLIAKSLLSVLIVKVGWGKRDSKCLLLLVARLRVGVTWALGPGVATIQHPLNVS